MTKNVIGLLFFIALGTLSLIQGSDVGVKNILVPSGIISPGDYNPRAQIKNKGGGDESLWVFFRILTLVGSTVYLDSSFEEFNANETKNVTFNTWTATLGLYITRCSLYLASDTNPVNDTLTGKVRVEVLLLGQWVSRESVPLGLSKKRVKDGGGLADGSRRGEKYIYVLKGNKTNEFYLYDPVLNTYQPKADVEISPTNPTKFPKRGACIIRSGDYVYLTRGNNTLEFWAYYIPDDTWTRLSDIPSGPKGKALKGGSSLAEGKIDNKKYLFLIKGSGTREFYAYDKDLNTWTEKAQTPYVTKETSIKKGSCLTSDGKDLYLLKGGYNEFFFYNCDSNIWYPKRPMPFIGSTGKKKKVKDGASMVCEKGQDIIFALKGGGTNEFWYYSIEGDSWHELASVPLGVKGKKVKGGGSLLLNSGAVFALKGGNTNELWMYVPDFPFFDIATNSSPNGNQNVGHGFNPTSRLLRDPAFAGYCRTIEDAGSLAIYDALGRKVKIDLSKSRDFTLPSLRTLLKPGTYFIAYPEAKVYKFRKIVILH